MEAFDAGAESERVQTFMRQQLAVVAAKFRQAKVYSSNAESDFEGLCKYFGERPTFSHSGPGLDPQTLFSLVQMVVGRVVANSIVARKKQAADANVK